jgi:hypothetical protein
MSARRIALGAALIALVLAAPTAAKEGTTARLTTDVPLDSAPGETFRIAWTLQLPDGQPFSALPVFVRLHGPDGASTTAIANEEGGYGSGEYVARAIVPAGGIERIQIGLRGSSEGFFPIENPPDGLAGAGKTSGSNGTRWTTPIVVVVGTAVLVLLLRRFPPKPTVATR